MYSFKKLFLLLALSLTSVSCFQVMSKISLQSLHEMKNTLEKRASKKYSLMERIYHSASWIYSSLTVDDGTPNNIKTKVIKSALKDLDKGTTQLMWEAKKLQEEVHYAYRRSSLSKTFWGTAKNFISKNCIHAKDHVVDAVRKHPRLALGAGITLAATGSYMLYKKFFSKPTSPSSRDTQEGTE